MSEIAKDFDFFVNASKADPNPTTILESMAWGFPVVCTPQSGYYENSYRLNIHREDKEGAVQTLRALQTMEEDRLLGMAEEARRVVLRDYTWDKFADVICRHMGLDES
jgi:glycosyltransferase involved in cell wall biosynthesis